MYRIVYTALFAILFINSQAQEVKCFREAILEKGGYTISGKAIIEELTNGTIRLLLSSDFTTPSGPDVQIYLSHDSVQLSGAKMIADIGTTDGLNHFSGAISFEVSGLPSINEFRYVVFRCVAFNLHWASGRLGDSSCGSSNPPISCPTSMINIAGGGNTSRFCASDGKPDSILFSNSLGKTPGLDYVYVLTNESGNIKQVITSAFLDFEGSGIETELVYGLSYSGKLTYNLGSHVSTISADSCVKVSTNVVILVKNECQSIYECLGTGTATTNWVAKLDICPSDGKSDLIPLKNSAFQNAGEHYAYIFTDSLRRIQSIYSRDTFNFEGSSNQTQRVYGVSYDGTLNYTVGMDLYTIKASGCAIVSDSTLFLTITKNACPPDTMSVDTSKMSSITGIVRTVNGVVIPQVSVILNDSIKVVTDSKGQYRFENIKVGTRVTLKALKNTNHLNGVSTSDIVTSQRHILALKVFDQAYQFIAGDVNNDGRISSIDLVLLRRLILGLDAEYKSSNSWRFTKAGTLTGMSSTFLESFEITIDEANLNVILDFVGVKIGDVNASALPD